MLSRRDIRIKVMQELYAFDQSDNDRLDVGEKQLLQSIENIYQLFIWQLSFLTELVEFAQQRMEENKLKFFPTEDDLKPNKRFVENRLINQIVNNRDFIKLRTHFKINFSEQKEMIRKFYNLIRQSPDFKKYMETGKDTYENDKAFITTLIKKHLVDFESLQYFFEDKDIHWVDDYDTVLILLERFAKSYKESYDEFYKFPTLLKINIDGQQEDKLFAKQLFRKCIAGEEKYDDIIVKNVTNWEFDRIAKMDIILIRMALCEFMHFPTIPVKVTINEYIDISKIFSSPKSKIFINGMLDKLAQIFKEEGLLKKSGRGLIEN